VRHLTGTMSRIRCGDCHGALPTSMTHADGTVQLQFGGLGSGTQWNGTTCSASYCHGAFRNGANGGTGVVMSWTAQPEPLGCTACHNRPHYAPHSGGDECWICHEHVNTGGTGFIEPALHLNGRVDRMNCSIGCHDF
jgi:predicted CxxxxCH...CXXCH cytochrome family protein